MTAAKSAVPPNLRIPDVGQLSPKVAALAYAQAGFYVLPVLVGKHPGSIVGKRWPQKSTIDAEQIERWWTTNQNAGIAIHTGRSGLTFFDLDRDTLPDELEWMKTGVVQFSRSEGERGHYGFFTGDEMFTSGDLKTSDGEIVGEIRSGNTVVIAAPSPHVKAAQGGQYRWRETGPNVDIEKLPEVARTFLRHLGTRNPTAMAGVSVQPHDDIVNQAIADWTDSTRLKTLAALTKAVREAGSATRNPVRNALRIAACESRIGFYPLAHAIDEIRTSMVESYRERGELDKFSEGEFWRLVKNGVGYALTRTPNEISTEANRTYGADEDGDATVIQGKFSSALVNSEAPPTTIRLSEVTPKRVEWLWKGWLPLGKLSLFEGESDVGKSTITINWASMVSTGAAWPETVTADGKTMASRHDPADVVLVGVEDSNADTVVPRLIAAGADLSRVHSLISPVDAAGNVQPFTIPHDIDWLRRAITEVKGKLVIIDPITACLPEDTKHGVDSSVRRILMSLADLAEETNSSIVMIRHFNKSTGMNAKNRGGGSVAFTALCRSVLQANELNSPADDGATHAISLAVGNLSKKLKSLTYKLENAPHMKALPPPEDDGLRVGIVKYCATSDLTADQLVGADGAKISDARKTAPMRDDAKDALREILADGKPHEMQPAVSEAMKLADCSKATVKNAAKEMGIIKEREYDDNEKVRCWTWRLPPVVIPRPGAKAADD